MWRLFKWLARWKRKQTRRSDMEHTFPVIRRQTKSHLRRYQVIRAVMDLEPAWTDDYDDMQRHNLAKEEAARP